MFLHNHQVYINDNFIDTHNNRCDKVISDLQIQIAQIENNKKFLLIAARQAKQQQYQLTKILGLARQQHKRFHLVRILHQIKHQLVNQQDLVNKILTADQQSIRLQIQLLSYLQLLFPQNTADYQNKLKILQLEADRVAQEITSQSTSIASAQIVAIQAKITAAQRLETMQAQVASMDGKIIAIERRIAMLAKELDQYQPQGDNKQHSAQQHRGNYYISKTANPGSANIELASTAQDLVVQQQQARLQQAEYKQARIKYLAEMAACKNILFEEPLAPLPQQPKAEKTDNSNHNKPNLRFSKKLPATQVNVEKAKNGLYQLNYKEKIKRFHLPRN